MCSTRTVWVLVSGSTRRVRPRPADRRRLQVSGVEVHHERVDRRLQPATRAGREDAAHPRAWERVSLREPSGLTGTALAREDQRRGGTAPKQAPRPGGFPRALTLDDAGRPRARSSYRPLPSTGPVPAGTAMRPHLRWWPRGGAQPSLSRLGCGGEGRELIWFIPFEEGVGFTHRGWRWSARWPPRELRRRERSPRRRTPRRTSQRPVGGPGRPWPATSLHPALAVHRDEQHQGEQGDLHDQYVGVVGGPEPVHRADDLPGRGPGPTR